jgi:trehalose 6-phosphate phosphatase
MNALYGPTEIKQRLHQTRPLWLFLDYDGTLANFAPTPDHIVPDKDLINNLYRLQKNPGVRIAIISGRRLGHIQKLLPVQGILLAGTYGIEIQDFEGKLIQRLDLEHIRQKISLIKPKLERVLEKTEGFYLEDKRWSLAIHARYADETSISNIFNKAYNLSKKLIAETGFQILGGDRFFEIAPKLANKGITVQFLIDQFPLTSALIVYIGDDDKDEQAFTTVKCLGGIPIVVSEDVRETEALLRFPSPEAVRKWITSLYK